MEMLMRKPGTEEVPVYRLMHDYLEDVVMKLPPRDYVLPPDFMSKKVVKPVPLASMRRPTGHVFGMLGFQEQPNVYWLEPPTNDDLSLTNGRSSNRIVKPAVRTFGPEYVSPSWYLPRKRPLEELPCGNEAANLIAIRSMKYRILELTNKTDGLSNKLKEIAIIDRDLDEPSTASAYVLKKPFELDPQPPPNMVQCRTCGVHVAQMELVYHKARCSSTMKARKRQQYRCCGKCRVMFAVGPQLDSHVEQCKRVLVESPLVRSPTAVRLLNKTAPIRDRFEQQLGEASLENVGVKELVSKFRQDALANIPQFDKTPLLAPDELPKPDEKGEMHCVVSKCEGTLKPRAERFKASQGKRWHCNGCGRYYRYIRTGDERLVMAAEWATRMSNTVLTEKKPFLKNITYRKTPPPFIRMKEAKTDVKVEPKEEVEDSAPLLQLEVSTAKSIQSASDEDDQMDSEEEELLECQNQLRNMSRSASSNPESLVSQVSPLPANQSIVQSVEISSSETLRTDSASSNEVLGDLKQQAEEGDSGFISVEELLKKETELGNWSLDGDLRIEGGCTTD